MDFLYPINNNFTHELLNNVGISSEYPIHSGYESKKDYIFDIGTKIIVIRENIGDACKWSFVKTASVEFYILNSNLKNIGNKETYKPSLSVNNNIDTSSEEISILSKEVFIPYIDKKNGLFSVRVQVDYEKILDLTLFNFVLEQVYFEGINILLSSRGYRSDNITINNLKNKYYTFGFINKDLDITARRPCESLTFTVSIPLNFFNNIEDILPSVINTTPTKYINFTNKNFMQLVEVLSNLLASRAGSVQQLLYPDKMLDTYVTDFEINSVRRFAMAAGELMAIADAPIQIDSEFVTEYSIGLTNDMELVYLKIKKYDSDGYSIISFNQGMLGQCRMRGEFNNKRIFNYLIEIKNMISDSNKLETFNYIKKYAKYPEVNLVPETLTINDITISPEQLRSFRMKFSQDAEKCIKPSDVQNLLNSGGDFAGYSDSLYHFFVPNDPKKNNETVSLVDSINKTKSILQDYRTNYKPGNKDFENNSSNINITAVATQLLETPGEAIKLANADIEKAADRENILNTLVYVSRRINFQKVLFNQLFCYLKGLNPNAKEVADILSQLPNDIINYINYVNNAQKLKGWKYIKALEDGLPLDKYLPLMCGDELTYLVKGIANITNAVNAGLQLTLKFVSDLDNIQASLKTVKKESPYSAIKKSVTKTLYLTATNFVFDMINQALIKDCEDPRLDSSLSDFRDPFNTHIAQDRYGGQENNNIDKIKNNRKRVFGETLPEIVRELTYGADLEYTIDIIGLLIQDIKCILSPIESVMLLRGNPTEELITIIKNLIRTKYSKDPNNLSYLLNEDKLILFFKKLGLTVDNKVLDEIEETISKISSNTGTTWVDVCSTADEDARKDAVEGKLPKELGVLQDDNRKRIEKAKKVLDKIKNTETIYNISVLCPENEDPGIQDLKENITKQYSDSIRSMFSYVLNTFTSEASSIPEKFIEDKQLIRKEWGGAGNIFDTYKYNTYHSNLYLNLKDNSTSQGITSNGISPYNVERLLYFPKDRSPISEKDLADMFLKTQIEAGSIDNCSGDQFILDNKFLKFLQEGRIIFENRPYNRKWDTTREQYKQRGFKDEKTLFYKELLEQQPELYEYIKNKKSIIFVSREKWFNEVADIAIGTAVVAGVTGLAVVTAGAVIGASAVAGATLATAEITAGAVAGALAAGTSVTALTVGGIAAKLTAEGLIYSATNNARDDYRIFVRHMYYDQGQDDFRMLYEGEYQNFESADSDDIKKSKKAKRNIFSQTLSVYSGEQIGRKEDKLTITLEEYFKKYNPNIKFIRRSDDAWYKQEFTSYILGEDYINLKDLQKPTKISGDENRYGVSVFIDLLDPKNTLNITQEFFTRATDNEINDISTYEMVLAPFNSYKEGGLFHIITNNNNDIVTKTVKVASSLPGSSNIDYLKYYSVSYDDTVFNTDQYKKLTNIVKDYLLVTQIELRKKIADSLFDKQQSSKYLKAVQSGKEDILNNEISFIETTGKKRDKSEDFYNNLQDRNLKIIKDEEYSKNDPFVKNYSNLRKLDFNNDIRYQTCNIYPHYLNLEYFLNSELNNAKIKLCDNNLRDVPKDMLDSILVNITVRAYVTDVCIKLIPLLSLLDSERLYKLYTQQYIIDIFREYIKQEMHTFTKEYPEEGDYFNVFVKYKVKKIYSSYESGENATKLVQKYVINTSSDNFKEIDYFIRKELNHFINFSLDKNIFTPSSFINELFVSMDNDLRSPLYYSPRYEEMAAISEFEKTNISKNLILNEFYNEFSYFLMASTVDFNKRGIFNGTKSELSKLFFRVVTEFNADTPVKYSNGSQEDVVKSINNLAYVPNPSLTAIVNPDLMKYVEFFVKASLVQTRSILLTNAQSFPDLNIILTRLINSGASVGGGLFWAFQNPETRKKLLLDAVISDPTNTLALIYKRFESTMPPIPWVSPDLFTSMALLFGAALPITPTGAAYLAFDQITDGIWTAEKLQEIEELRKTILDKANKELCEINSTDIIQFTCSTENKKLLIDNINKFEEG